MATEHLDVLVVGAGISGIGAAHHLRTELPDKSFAILEARAAIGGTWDLFRYPGIRSDSDMQTLGYRFRPWTDEKAIADGPSILRYLYETAEEDGTFERIRFNHSVLSAEWSSAEARWHVTAKRTDTDETVELTCGFLFGCTGYFDYEEGFTPAFAGIERFGGPVVHPQHWPEDLDYEGKRVVVIGSGATAVTLVPALAERAAHVTMLQRSPTYIVTVPERDPIANGLRRILPERVAYPITRWKNVLLMAGTYALSRRRPGIVRSAIRAALKRQLPDGYAIDTHFKPRYDPWDQRICAVPDGDLFRSIRRGEATVVTDAVQSFIADGILLESGGELDADVVITATGLNLRAFGGIDISVDGEAVALSERMAYRGMMLSDVPNFAFSVGYTNASWTLKVDLACEYVCRLLDHMDEHGYDRCVPVNDDPTVSERPLLDFAAGYVQRSIDEFPKQGSKPPWEMSMSYLHDWLRRGRPIADGVMRFSRTPVEAAPPEPLTAVG